MVNQRLTFLSGLFLSSLCGERENVKVLNKIFELLNIYDEI